MRKHTCSGIAAVALALLVPALPSAAADGTLKIGAPQPMTGRMLRSATSSRRRTVWP